jgi:hypothetical protein
MHSSERKKISQALSVSCKIHRIKHAKCCAEDKAPRGYSSGWKIQIHTKKRWMKMKTSNHIQPKLQICKNKRMKVLHCAKSLTTEHVFYSS